MKERIFSGIQPSGDLHIGNYLGAIKNWVALQDTHENIFCIVDLHAITVPQDPKILKKKIREIANIYLAAGVDPKKSTIFVQSDRPEHSELAWILNTITHVGELRRMAQFKDKSGLSKSKELDKNYLNYAKKDAQEHEAFTKDIGRAGDIISEYIESKKFHTKKSLLKLIKLTSAYIDASAKFIDHSTSSLKKRDKFNKELANTAKRLEEETLVGLFDYPVLMAADILLYNASLVPVGKDQFQHIELARDLAERFNKRFGETFEIPKPFFHHDTMTIMGLDDPTKKMAKSAKSEYNAIALTDSEEIVRKKISKAVTDSGDKIKAGDKKPAVTNLLNINSAFSGKTISNIEKKYKGKSYKDFKDGLADEVWKFLKPFQKKLAKLEKDPAYTEKVLKDGAKKLEPQAQDTLKKVKKAVGLGL